MAGSYIQAQFTEQMPFVGTPRQRRLVDLEAARDAISRATVIRRALDLYFDGRDEELEEVAQLQETR